MVSVAETAAGAGSPVGTHLGVTTLGDGQVGRGTSLLGSGREWPPRFCFVLRANLASWEPRVGWALQAPW